jgi:hypothetical protein
MGFQSLAHGALLAATVALTAGAASPTSPIQGLEALPKELGGFTRIGQITDYESRPGGAGLGAGVDFREAATGAIGTVYFYTRGWNNLANLAEGARSLAVGLELDTAGREIERAGQTRNYTITARSRATDLPGGGKPPALRCDAYVLAFADGRSTDSYACVGVRNGRFLKLRVSIPRRPDGAPETLLARFGNAVLGAVRD